MLPVLLMCLLFLWCSFPHMLLFPAVDVNINMCITKLFSQCDFQAVYCLDLSLVVVKRNSLQLYNLQMSCILKFYSTDYCSLSIMMQPQKKNHNLHEASTLWSSGIRCPVVWWFNTNVSVQPATSTFRVHSSEMLIPIYETTRYHILANWNFHTTNHWMFITTAIRTSNLRLYVTHALQHRRGKRHTCILFKRYILNIVWRKKKYLSLTWN
jgi:hypothetical protein